MFTLKVYKIYKVSLDGVHETLSLKKGQVEKRRRKKQRKMRPVISLNRVCSSKHANNVLEGQFK